MDFGLALGARTRQAWYLFRFVTLWNVLLTYTQTMKGSAQPLPLQSHVVQGIQEHCEALTRCLEIIGRHRLGSSLLSTLPSHPRLDLAR